MYTFCDVSTTTPELAAPLLLIPEYTRVSLPPPEHGSAITESVSCPVKFVVSPLQVACVHEAEKGEMVRLAATESLTVQLPNKQLADPLPFKLKLVCHAVMGVVQVWAWARAAIPMTRTIRRVTILAKVLMFKPEFPFLDRITKPPV
jgi:hypothetical protein